MGKILDSQEKWSGKWKEEKTHNPTVFVKKVYKKLKDNLLEESNILEIGAGLGEDALFLAKKGFKVTATDFSIEAINRIPFHLNLSKKFLDVTNISTDIGTFDLVYAHLSLHYFDNSKTLDIFQNIFNIIKPGGYLCVKCKSDKDKLAYIGNYEGNGITDVSGKKYNFFSKEFLKDLVKDYKILYLRRTSSIYKHYKSAFVEVIVQKINNKI